MTVLRFLTLFLVLLTSLPKHLAQGLFDSTESRSTSQCGDSSNTISMAGGSGDWDQSDRTQDDANPMLLGFMSAAQQPISCTDLYL